MYVLNICIDTFEIKCIFLSLFFIWCSVNDVQQGAESDLHVKRAYV